jgi:hypothetical protein
LRFADCGLKDKDESGLPSSVLQSAIRNRRIRN